MGRYYNTNNFSGKFGFAVQDSNDAEIFGMEEQEPTSIDYYLEGTDEAKEKVRKVLDEQYEMFGIPTDKRIYRIDPSKNYEEFKELDLLLDKVAYRPYDEEKDKDIIPYAMDDETCDKLGWKRGTSAVPTDKRYPLARCRIYLGVKILSDLEIDGYCDLNAEL